MAEPCPLTSTESLRIGARLALPRLPDLEVELLSRINRIPRGAVATFGDLARSLGDRHAALWASQWIALHDHDNCCGCHRVVRATGELDRSSGRRLRQHERLGAEGVPFVKSGAESRVDLSARHIQSGLPSVLRPLQDWLDQAARTIDQRPLRSKPRLAAGLDVAYRRDGVAVGAAVVVNCSDREIVWRHTISRPVRFPYIPGYLTFRELPVLQAVWLAVRAAGFNPDVVFVDGQGRLHPRRAGLATGFAAVTGRPTVGVAKSLLCGRSEASLVNSSASVITDGGEQIGVALSHPIGHKPIYVSVGGFLSLADAQALTERFLTTRRLPIPVHTADRLSKHAARGRPSGGGA